MLTTQKPQPQQVTNQKVQGSSGEKEPQQIQVNHVVIEQPNNSILIEHLHDKKEYIFKDSANNIIGSFNVYQLFKYLNSDINEYLPEINLGNSKDVIEKYIYSLDIDTNHKYELISHLDSPFTSNIEMILKLYKDIRLLDELLLKQLIDKPLDIASKIKDRNSQFIYNILQRILRLSNTIIDKIDNKNNKDELLRYNIGAVYKMTEIVKEDIQIKTLQIENIKTDINKLLQIQENMTLKMNELKSSLDQQSDECRHLIKQISKQQGGSKSSSRSSSKSSTTTSQNNLSETTVTKSISSKKTSIQTESSQELSQLSHTPIHNGGKKSIISENLNTSEFDKYNFSESSITPNITVLDKSTSATNKTRSFNGSYNISSILVDDTASFILTESVK